MFLLAERLSLTVTQVREMSSAEFLEWMAFDEWRHQEHDFAVKKAEMESGRV